MARGGASIVSGRDISIIKEKNLCPFCSHHKAWSKKIGTFCTRCGKDVNEKPEKIKPMRIKGVHPKYNWKINKRNISH